MSKKILDTKRLILEELDQHHIDDLYKLLSNPKVQKHFPKTLTLNETIGFLDKVKDKYSVDGTSFWAVIDKINYQFLGICGLLKQNIDDVQETEVAYRINDMFWNQGFATEASNGCLKYAKEKLKLKSIISLILPENKPSIRVAMKNSLIYEKDTLFQNRIHQVYRIRF